MNPPAFRRDRVRGITQAEIERVVRAAKAADPGAIVELDPITKKIRILSASSAPPANELDRELADFETRNAQRQNPEAKHGQGSA